MKTILLPILLVFFSMPVFASGDWHEDIISKMNSEKNVERALVVDRDPETGKIRQANYKYTFKQKSLYKTLREKLINRESEATNFILRPGDDGQIIMKFTDSDGHRNYSLSHVGNKYLLIISAGSGPQPKQSSSVTLSSTPKDNKQIYIYRQPDNTKKQAEWSKQQAERTRQQAKEQSRRQAEWSKQQAERTRQQAKEQSRRQAEWSKQQAERTRQQAERTRQQAERTRQRAAELSRRQAERTRKLNDNSVKEKSVIIFDNNDADSEDISTRLKTAEAERKRLLRKK